MIEEERSGSDVPELDLPLWRERFGIAAGITTRGSAAVPFDLGLNTGSSIGESLSRWRKFRAAHPEFPSQVIAHQVHGSQILWHDTATGGWTIYEQADGHATATPGLLLLASVADCVPIFLAVPARRMIALLHSGWRGTAAGILEKGVELLTNRAGVDPSQVVMHLGPAISGDRYEVGREVVEGLKEDPVGEGPWQVDLREILQRRGTALGIGEISVSPHCTAAPGGPFFSHRASRGADGRMIAWLGLLPDHD